ncbi:MAG: DUF3592 domain-containing protein [Bryobacteraceae bacterium]
MRKPEWRKTLRRAAPVPDPPAGRPRPVRLTGAGRVLAFLGTLFAAVSLIAGFALFSVAQTQRELRKRIESERMTVTAQVVSLRRTRGDNARYLVDYEFAAGGQLHRGRAAIRRADWSRLKAGSAVTVHYQPSEPERNWIAGYEPRPLPLWVPPLVSLGAACLSALCWREIRRQQVLLAEGRLAEGRVLEVKKSGRGQGAQGWSVRYEFRTLSGSRIVGRRTLSGNPPEAGGTVRVFYDPDNPARNAIYPLSLVRPA